MPWTAPSGTSYIFPWEDTAAGGTPLTAANLKADATDVENFVLAVAASLDSYLENLIAQSLSGGGSGGGITSVFGRTTAAITAQSGDYTVGQVTGAAPINNPTLTGTVAVPTPSGSDSSAAAANTGWVTGKLAAVTELTPVTVASSATPTVVVGGPQTMAEIGPLATNVSGVTVSGAGQEGYVMVLLWQDNATPRTLAHGSSFQNGPASLLTGTLASKWHTEMFIYRTNVSKWVCYYADPTGY